MTKSSNFTLHYEGDDSGLWMLQIPWQEAGEEVYLGVEDLRTLLKEIERELNHACEE